jgi:hypothetical protein
LHFVSPSSDVPEPLVAKLTVLSFKHDETKLLTSWSIEPFLSGSSPALLNFQDCSARIVVLVVVPVEEESSFLQLKKTIAMILRMKSLFLMDLIWVVNDFINSANIL